jgi:hypothetical protein
LINAAASASRITGRSMPAICIAAAASSVSPTLGASPAWRRASKNPSRRSFISTF